MSSTVFTFIIIYYLINTQISKSTLLLLLSVPLYT